MAAILDPDGSLDLKELLKGMEKVLPPYARPMFIRIVKTIDLTGTYKLRKVDYQKDGIEVEKIKDQVFLLDASTKSYIPFTTELHEDLKSGKIRV